MSTSLVRMAARPAPVEINLHSTVFLVVDMQNDIVAEGGLLTGLGVDVSIVERVVLSTARALIAARAAGIPVVYLRMGLRRHLPDTGANASPNTDIIRELAPWPEDTVIDHHRFSGFFETTLHDTLRRLGARHLIVTGCTTSVGVESTIRDAMSHDYGCVLLGDCTAEPIGHGLRRSNYDATLLLVERLFGWVSTSEEFTKTLRREYSEWMAGDLQLTSTQPPSDHRHASS